MRIILITGNDLAHRYVSNRLAEEIELAAILVEQGTGGHGRWRKLWKRYTIGQLVSRACLRLLARVRRDGVRQHNRMLEILAPEKCTNFLFPRLITHVHGINSKEGVRVVSSLQPDVILVFGTGVVGKSVLSLARNLALNLHTGISPYYRGSDCTFWPLYNNELHMLGATVHECTMQLDGGRIFAVGHAGLEADDDLYSVFPRCLMVGADLYVRVIKDFIRGRMEGSPQDFSVGREYKAVMRDVKTDLKVRRQIRNGLIRRYVTCQELSKRATEVSEPRYTTKAAS